ncbi:cytochrome c biogenesis protein DipZ [Legionella fallonii]|uniref:Cytochrome c biogenesis protein [Thioredoxin fold] n=1 Tax=Legionella fallonii LLAP-10 TaxID=1212491 RepID=A0A098G8L3_9GAMM|nr:cytochrome c biogenesis protein DipZ [Legionella fallonii]CEG58324.1 Cytochrome c biogenesis protein [Thioredoxin fold] [Legionella fallonii LLAP-10]
MQADIVNIGLGFLEGFALIISPCVLPILPLILAGSLTGSKKRPLGIMIGFILIFSLFTFLSRKFVQYSGIDLNIVRHISYGMLILLGVTMISTYLTEKFERLTTRLANIGSSFPKVNNPQGGLISGIFFGGLIAIVWTPCAGPILAAVIVQTVIQKTNLMSFLTLIAFGIGVAVPMLAIILFGRQLMARVGFVKGHTVFFRKMLGAVIIISVFFMIYQENGISFVHAGQGNNVPAIELQNGLEKPYPAPSISGIDGWINSEPLKISNLKGKVVLVDFWTYSCINCIRTLPYLKEWYDKYHNDGLVIVGVHTPEFDFEKNFANVKSAVVYDGIKYPVALDSHYITWQNFNNQYWPAHYLIDKKGNVVYIHFGEGDYDVTENNIQYLLNMHAPTITKGNNIEQLNEDQTPETYLGYERAENFSGQEAISKDKTAQYTFPPSLEQNEWALQGSWNIMPDKIISSENNAAIKINFNARKVYIVMGNATNKTIRVNLLLNGKKIEIEKGKDVENSSIDVNKNTIYEALVFTQPRSGILQLTASSPGLEIYTFTFG